MPEAQFFDRAKTMPNQRTLVKEFLPIEFSDRRR
jgi:hypothetical protein